MFSRLRALPSRLSGYRCTRLTSEGVQFLLFTLAVGIAAINTGNNLFYLLLAMMLSLILMSGIVAERCLRGLEFHRHLPDLLFAGESAVAAIAVKNRRSRLPSFSLRLMDIVNGQDTDRGLVVHQLMPGAGQLLSYPLTAASRGRLTLDGIRVVTTFPFGLFRKAAFYAVPDQLVVCPAVKPLADSVLHELTAAGHERQTRQRGHGGDLYNLRLYHSGDDSRQIHWVTTAKTAQLIVRETEAEAQQRATVRLSTVAPLSHDARFEEAVALAASLLAALSARGYAVRLIAGEFHSEFGLGEAHLRSLLKALALCERREPRVRRQADAWSDPAGDGAEGLSIELRPWNGDPTEPPSGADLLFDETAIAEVADVV